MKILIHYTRLSESPFSELSNVDGQNSIFKFIPNETEGLVLDIINGNPTTYLISGYRGSGKSSFIKKIEFDIRKKILPNSANGAGRSSFIKKIVTSISRKNLPHSGNKGNRTASTLFVYLNFAKHEGRSILFRKLIRSFYLQFREKKFNLNRKDKKTFRGISGQFKDLYDRTFYNVSINSNKKKIDKLTTSIALNIVFKDIIPPIGSIIGTYEAVVKYKITAISVLIVLALGMFAILKYVALSIKFISETTNTNEVSKSMLYDDEIAEYYLLEIIDKLKTYIKPIFVLDELDKIPDDEIVESLINELKPLMLSGLCSFIVVAGQSLYYNYYIAQTKDDGALSSIFSKMHHVSLSTVAELSVLFDNLIEVDKSRLSLEESELLDAYKDYLILESKRIPRRFIIQIRQKLQWENDKAFIQIDKTIDELRIYSKILRQIETINQENIVDSEYPGPIKDYFSMQLFLSAHRILNKQNQPFTKKDILTEYGI